MPVPDDATQMIYVWFEALSSYLSSVGYGHEDAASRETFAKWWPVDAQIIGKDNLRFHAIIWPGLLFSAGLELPRTIFVHGFVTVEGQKISKTVGNVISPDEVVAKYGSDPVRYYFLREFPAHEDGDFSYKKFEERYNGDLANGLGNLVARVATLGEKISPISLKDAFPDERPWSGIDASYDKKMREFRLNEALGHVWGVISMGDKYINDRKPWAVSNEAELRGVIGNAAHLVGTVSRWLYPFLPETARKINEQIDVGEKEIIIKKGPHLFPRLD